MAQIQGKTGAVAGEENSEKQLDGIGGEGGAGKGMQANNGEGVEAPTDGGGGGGAAAAAAASEKESAVDQKKHCEEMYSKAKAALELAEEVKAMAEAYSEAPDRLSNEFIATTFPFDRRDNSYTYCIICGLPGDLLLCDNDGCPNVMHGHCGGLTEVPEADWFCGQCVPIPSNGDDMKEDIAPAASTGAKSASSPDKEKPEDYPEVDKTDNNEDDGKGGPKGNGTRPAAVTSCLPPIVTFDDEKASKLSSELDDLYFFRIGRRRGEKVDDDKEEKQWKLGKKGFVSALLRAQLANIH
jgi:hypothetical protein